MIPISVFCLDNSLSELESGTSMMLTTTQRSSRWRRWSLIPTSDPMDSTMTLLSSPSRDRWPSVSISSPSVCPLDVMLMRHSLTPCPWLWAGAPPTMMVMRWTFSEVFQSLYGQMKTATRHTSNQSLRYNTRSAQCLNKTRQLISISVSYHLSTRLFSYI